MGLETWAVKLGGHRRAAALVALVTTFAGVAFLIDRPKGTVLEWFALPFLVCGGAIFAWAVWPRSATTKHAPLSAAAHLLARLTFNGRLVPFFPAIGVGIVLADLTYNLLLSATPALQTEDTIVLLAAGTLLGYNIVPSRFARERDFVLLFFMSLNAILVLPLLIARTYYADFEQSVNVYSWVALAPETSALLSLVGVSNTIHAVAGSTAPGLTFSLRQTPMMVTVVITTACSGIYSFGIFASAFVAFVLTEYETLTKRLWLILALGLSAAYVANVLRMVAIVLVGYYGDSGQTDLQNMLIAHSYFGWIIFLGWIALFWGSIFRFLPVEQSRPGARAIWVAPRRAANKCGICSGALTPALPATRCACGIPYHRACEPSTECCPSCGRQIGPRELPYQAKSKA